ncbi:PH domain containing protein [Nitzschia inconspicua]|uniref:PH domain containing protein n=1 Tax=Nitzschia inconspicua TaxID=303405 RepID=A0A9K3LBY0_9STRA|nr:PH domain containing protein [Nitzschia inconspicua]KAG7358698.1 PH domain containing protein [Nitzschia inconspicua]
MAGRAHLARPPYVDPNTNIIYDTDRPEYEGWLTKQSMWLKDWRRRYFLLKGSKLFYSKNEWSSPHGMIDLAHCTTVKSADLKSKKRHSFEISTPEITYLLYADTEQEKDDWIGRVGKAIVRCSSTYYSSAEGGGRGGQQQQQQTNNALYRNQQGGMPQPGMLGSNNNNNPYQQDGDDDDDDIYYEDPNNPNPYFND